MRRDLMVDLDECLEFRQLLRAHAPRFVHGASLLLVLLVGTSLAWLALTEADLVVRAPGRVRPVTGPPFAQEEYSEDISCEASGRVVEVEVREGDPVRRGDVLLRLDTRRIENQIGALWRTIEAEEEEIGKLDRLQQLLAEQHEAARNKAEAELAEAGTAHARALERQAADIRLVRCELTRAEDEHARLKNLAAEQVVSEQEAVAARARLGETREKLSKVEVPLDQGRVEVLRRALDLIGREREAKREELEINRRTKAGKLAADRLTLANLEMEREQAVVRAPIDGVVTAARVKAGDILQPGKAGITMARQGGVLFEAAVTNADVALLRTGMPVHVRLDAYDYQKYGVVDGTIEFVAPDSEVIEGSRDGAAALYKVRIALAADEVGHGECRGPLKLGMSGLADIVTDRESLLVLFLRRIRQTISLS